MYCPFRSSSLFDDLLTKLHLPEKVVGRQKENALYRASAPFPVSRHSRPSPSSRWTVLTRTACQQQLPMLSPSSRLWPFLPTRCFHLHFRDYPPSTCTPSPFVDRGPLLKRNALSALVQEMWGNEAIEIVRYASSPGFCSHLFLVPKMS